MDNRFSLRPVLLTLGLLGVALDPVALAEEAPASSLKTALEQGNVQLNQRLRFEHVEQDGVVKDATAFTLRSRLAYKTGKWQGLQAFLEYEGTAAFGGRSYAPESAGRPVIADPTGNELNRWWIEYAGIPDTAVKMGRQRVVINNSRVVGHVGWRQNEQTFDGISLSNQSLANTTVTAAWLNNSNFILYNNRPLEAGLLNVSNGSVPGMTLAAYALSLDFDQSGADTLTLGVRGSGKAKLSAMVTLLYTAEYASQRDHADNPAVFSEDYLHGELGLAVAPLTLKLGYEELGGDGSNAVQFPLATLHKFNGWADQFLATPAAGLEDLYLAAWLSIEKFKFGAIWHEFSPANGGPDHGSELDLLVARPLGKNIKVVAKFADYRADSHKVDTRKFSLQLDLAIN